MRPKTRGTDRPERAPRTPVVRAIAAAPAVGVRSGSVACPLSRRLSNHGRLPGTPRAPRINELDFGYLPASRQREPTRRMVAHVTRNFRVPVTARPAVRSDPDRNLNRGVPARV